MTAQKFDHRPKHVLITGTSGSGKTTLFQKLLQAERARVKWVFDHQGEFSSRFDLPAVVDMEGLYKATAIGGWAIVDPIRLADETDEKEKRLGIEGAFGLVCDFCFRVSADIRGRKIFACDELQKLTGTKGEPTEILTILDTGRRYQLDFFCISQAPNRIHNAIRNQLTHVYTFRQSDTNAVAYLRENGFDENQIRTLPRGSYLARNLDTGEFSGGKVF